MHNSRRRHFQHFSPPGRRFPQIPASNERWAAIEESLQNVRREQVGDLVEIKQEDIFTLDLSQADVVMLYLLPKMNVKLIPQLRKLKKGSRIVAHNYWIEGIAHEKSLVVKSLEDGVEHDLYLYTAPLRAEEE